MHQSLASSAVPNAGPVGIDDARLATAPAGELFDCMMASGRYRMQADRIITTVESAWHPAWIGTEQTRYFQHDGDALSLMSDFIELSCRCPIFLIRATHRDLQRIIGQWPL